MCLVCLRLGKTIKFSILESLRRIIFIFYSNIIYSFGRIFLLGEYCIIWLPHYVFQNKRKIKTGYVYMKLANGFY